MRTRLIAVAAAVLGPALLWLAVAGIGGHPLTVSSPDGRTIDVPLPTVMLFALVFSLLGWGFLALLERLLPRRAAVIWAIVATLVLLVSFAPLAGEMDTGTRVTLGVMHVLVAAALFAGFLRRRAS
ncbi:DUF6069 family protein [Catenuloplanes atrovinosus]|uniref:Uncharacterized protein n=1 Tax=Catenuloplanes atrovinosus TaxID=137266 RepID=A0AAE3YKT3_9ACTN|nr:DUF6069 family protein [Catenuloplanes atrovinosus]MDR7274126.1 hypothetical protein [Catenuloplanes atrovinosus]